MSAQPRPYGDAELETTIGDLQTAINQLQERLVSALKLTIEEQPQIPDDIAAALVRQVEHDPRLLQVHQMTDRLSTMVAQILEIEAALPA